MADDITEKFTEVSQKIASATSASGRKPESVHLVVVTKGQSVEKISTVIRAGAKELGENYPEETHRKISEMGDEKSLVRWYMIGHLQSRKIKYILPDFSMIQSIDGLDIARELSAKLQTVGKRMDALLEVNVSGEESKHGFAAWQESSWPALADTFALLQQEAQALHFVGLMTMPPYAEIAENSRPYFERCRKLCEFIHERNHAADFVQLSMGTSLDYAVAVAAGATYVRVGEAIMGARFYQ